MAANYTVVTQYPDTEYLGGTQTRPVTAVGFLTVPGEIYFESRIPDSAYSQAEVDATGKVNAEPLINVLALPNVTDVEWTQVVRPSGYLADEIIIYFQTPSGNSNGSITVPFTGLTAAGVKPKIDAAVAALVASENL